MVIRHFSPSLAVVPPPPTQSGGSRPGAIGAEDSMLPQQAAQQTLPSSPAVDPQYQHAPNQAYLQHQGGGAAQWRIQAQLPPEVRRTADVVMRLGRSVVQGVDRGVELLNFVGQEAGDVFNRARPQLAGNNPDSARAHVVGLLHNAGETTSHLAQALGRATHQLAGAPPVVVATPPPTSAHLAPRWDAPSAAEFHHHMRASSGSVHVQGLMRAWQSRVTQDVNASVNRYQEAPGNPNRHINPHNLVRLGVQVYRMSEAQTHHNPQAWCEALAQAHAEYDRLRDNQPHHDNMLEPNDAQLDFLANWEPIGRLLGIQAGSDQVANPMSLSERKNMVQSLIAPLLTPPPMYPR